MVQSGHGDRRGERRWRPGRRCHPGCRPGDRDRLRVFAQDGDAGIELQPESQVVEQLRHRPVPFIDQTWLATVKQSGASLGYGRYADAITRTSSGRYVVHNASARRAVMNLRYDPSANAVMAGAFTKANAARLTRALGRTPTDGELYIAHVLGQSGAVKLISTAENAPKTDAAHLFPHAARANRSIFFDKQGGPRSSADVYRVLVAKHDGTAP